MYRKTTYSLIAAAVVLFAGCGNSEQKTEATTSAEHKTAVEMVVGTKPEPKKEQSVAIETHGPKEEPNIAKVPAAAVPSPMPVQKQQKPEVKVEKPTVNAAALFKSCAGCHGAKGEKKALGKSEIIAGWSSLKVQEALKGYRSKKRNIHGMGAVMQGQAAKLSDDEIKALGDYIEKLK